MDRFPGTRVGVIQSSCRGSHKPSAERKRSGVGEVDARPLRKERNVR